MPKEERDKNTNKFDSASLIEYFLRETQSIYTRLKSNRNHPSYLVKVASNTKNAVTISVPKLLFLLHFKRKYRAIVMVASIKDSLIGIACIYIKLGFKAMIVADVIPAMWFFVNWNEIL